MHMEGSASDRYKWYPRLWRSPEDDGDQHDKTAIEQPSVPPGFSSDGSTASFLRARQVPSTDLVSLKVVRPHPRTLGDIANKSLVVAQEFALTCLFLARHRAITPLDVDRDDVRGYNSNTANGEWKQVVSMGAVALVVMLILYYAESARSLPDGEMNGTKKRLLIRATDAVLLAAILRFLSSVLRTLTASYSCDTVNALAIGGMVVHLLACDYSYAHGISKKKVSDGSNKRQAGRPTFSGGTVSLNAALFSTTLLASRLPTNVASYAFISSAVISFAFYPAARHAIAKKSQSQVLLSPCQIITTATSSATLPLLENSLEQTIFLITLACICVVSPVVRWRLQHHKEIICGPWDIAHIVVEE